MAGIRFIGDTRRWLVALVALAGAGAAASAASCTDDGTAVLPADAGADATQPVDAARPLDAAADAPVDAAPEASACTLVDAASLDDAQVQAGLSLVQQYKCQKCHGQVLSGNNNGIPSPFGGFAYPPNLTPDPNTGLGCWSDDEIVNAILHGIDDQGVALCAPMPRFEDAGLDSGAALQIAQFLRSLAPVVNQVPETRCSAPDAGDAGGDASDAASDAGASDAALD